MSELAELLAALDGLIRDRPSRPSLWRQLGPAVAHTGKGSGAPTAVSRPPVSITAISLLEDIRQTAASAAVDLTGRSTGNAPGDLMRVVGHLITRPDPERIDRWTTALRHWAAQARAVLGDIPPGGRWIRDWPCPACGSVRAAAISDQGAVHTPALAVIWHRPDEDGSWSVAGIECRCCGAGWMRGPDLDALIQSVLHSESRTGGVSRANPCSA